jgi:hypothetical protein
MSFLETVEKEWMLLVAGVLMLGILYRTKRRSG